MPASVRVTRSQTRLKNNSQPDKLLELDKLRSAITKHKKKIKRLNINNNTVIDKFRYHKNKAEMAEGGSAQVTREELDNEWKRLREFQRQIDEQRAVLETTRRQMQQQHAANLAQAHAMNQQANSAVGENPADRVPHAQVLDGLVNHLQYLQINMPVPKFSENSNPMNFIDELDRYFKFKNVREEHKLLVVESLIEGRLKIWFEIEKNVIANFEAFKVAFKNEFYSVPVKVRIKNQWATRRYSGEEESLHGYFFKQLKESRYFDPPLSAYEINFAIIQQLPIKVQIALSTLDYSQTNLVTQALSQMDVVHKQFEQKRSREWHNQNNNSSYNRGAGKQVAVNNIQTFSQPSRQVDNAQRYKQFTGNNDLIGHRSSNNSNGGYRGRNSSNFNSGPVLSNNRNENMPSNQNIIPDTRFPPPKIRHTATSSRDHQGQHLN